MLWKLMIGLQNRHGLGNMTEASQDIALEILTMPGKSYQDIAGMHGVSRQRVGQIARRLDVSRGYIGGTG